MHTVSIVVDSPEIQIFLVDMIPMDRNVVLTVFAIVMIKIW